MSRAGDRKLEQALAALDPRFAPRPVSPFAALAGREPPALDELVQAAERTEASVSDRVAALEALGDALARIRNLDDARAARLGALASNDPEPEVRREAAATLARSAHPGFVGAFQNRLAAPDESLAAAAAHTMGLARWRPAVPYLIELFARAEGVRVRAETAWALGEIGDVAALELLEAAYRNDVMPIAPVIAALGKLGDLDIASLLLVALRHAHPAVRRTTAEALLRIFLRHPGKRLAQFEAPLLAAFEVEDDALARAWLYGALTHLGVRADAAKLSASLGVELTAPETQTLLQLMTARR